MGRDCFLLSDSEFGDRQRGFRAETAGKRAPSVGDEAGGTNGKMPKGRTPGNYKVTF